MNTIQSVPPTLVVSVCCCLERTLWAFTAKPTFAFPHSGARGKLLASGKIFSVCAVQVCLCMATASTTTLHAVICLASCRQVRPALSMLHKCHDRISGQEQDAGLSPCITWQAIDCSAGVLVESSLCYCPRHARPQKWGIATLVALGPAPSWWYQSSIVLFDMLNGSEYGLPCRRFLFLVHGMRVLWLLPHAWDCGLPSIPVLCSAHIPVSLSICHHH